MFTSALVLVLSMENCQLTQMEYLILGLHMCVAYASLILRKQNIFCDLIMMLRQILTVAYAIAAA